MGEIEWKSNNAKEALKWWCQAIRCHESNPHDLDNSPYLYLGAVAGAFGLKKEYDIFMRRAKSIRDATLSPEAFSDIQNLFIQQKTNEMHDIIKGIVKLVG